MFAKQLSVLALAGQALAQTPSLLQALNSSSSLSQLSGILALSPDLVGTLGSAQNITILAPSNAAFAKVDNATLAGLTANPGLLTAILQYHVLNGTVYGSQVTNTSAFVPTLLTNNLFTNVSTANFQRSGENVNHSNRLLEAKEYAHNCAMAMSPSSVDSTSTPLSHKPT